MILSRELLLFYFVIFHIALLVRSDCKINVKLGMHRSNPPMLISDTTAYDLLYPDITKDPTSVVIENGKFFNVICPSNSMTSNTEVSTKKQSSLVYNEKDQLTNILKIKCTQNQLQFESTNQNRPNINVDFTKLSCKGDDTILRAVKDSNQQLISCGNNGAGKLYEIGLHLQILNHLKFVRTIDLCFNDALLQPLWAHATIQPFNQDDTRYTKRDEMNRPVSNDGTFKAGIVYKNYFSEKKKSPYKVDKQQEKFMAILDKEQDYVEIEYINTTISANKYLAKGHLIARADMFYRAEQSSTYFFANVAPMWQVINANGNWLEVEKLVRKYALEKKIPLEVYVGWLENLVYEGKTINLYQTNKIQVPKILFKCVIDKKNNRGLCFLVSNDPKLKNDDNTLKQLPMHSVKNPICNNVNDKFKDTTLGYTYCVDIKTFVDNTRTSVNIIELANYNNFNLLDLSVPPPVGPPLKKQKTQHGK